MVRCKVIINKLQKNSRLEKTKRSESLRIKLTKSKLWKDSKFGKRKNKYLRHKIKESEELVQIDSECKKEAEE